MPTSSCVRYGFVTFETEEEADKVRYKVLQWIAAVHVWGRGRKGYMCLVYVCMYMDGVGILCSMHACS